MLTHHLCAALLLGAALGSNIDYQIHSNNDLREWRQLLLKGARRFKVDPHYLDTKSCEAAGITNKDGCLLLNHDRPTPKASNYNSSDDLLSLLTSAEFRELSDGDNVTVAMCFKSAPDRCDASSAAFNSWLSLVDDLHARATASLPPGTAPVELLLDGDGKPSGCLQDRWRPWASVWIGSDGASPPDALWSSDPQLGYDRFAVLNNRQDLANWTWLAQDDVQYGKFSNEEAQPARPYQLWEPDAQSDIHEYAALYAGSSPAGSGGTDGPHSAGFHFAINVDVAMFDVYAAGAGAEQASDPSVRGAVNQRMFPLASRPALRALPAGSIADSAGADFFTVFADSSAGSPQLLSNVLSPSGAASVSTLVPQDQSVPLPQSEWLLSSGAHVTSVVPLAQQQGDGWRSLVVMSNRRMLLLDNVTFGGDAGIQYGSWATGTCPQDDWGDVDVGVFDVQPLPPAQAQAVGCVPEDGEDCLLVLSEGGRGEGLQLFVIRVSVNGSTLTSRVQQSLCVPLPDGTRWKGSKVSSARLAVLDDRGAAVLMVVAAVDGLVSGTTKPLADLSLDKRRAAAAVEVEWRWRSLSVGTHLTASLVPDTPGDRNIGDGGGDGGVLLLHVGDGFCFNSHSHNTRASPTVCEQAVRGRAGATTGVLDYSVGLVSDWLQLLRLEDAEGENENTLHLTPCHDRILHGTYDQGSFPAVAAAAAPAADGTSQPVLLAMHEGVPGDSMSSPRSMLGDNGCGSPLPHRGLVVDSYQLNNWVAALRRHKE